MFRVGMCVIGFCLRESSKMACEHPTLVLQKSKTGQYLTGKYQCKLCEKTISAAKPRQRGSENPIPLGLTKRESEVLRWLAQGKSSAEIASILAISPKTVSKHLAQIYRTLGVENRLAAALAWEAARSLGSTPSRKLRASPR